MMISLIFIIFRPSKQKLITKLKCRIVYSKRNKHAIPSISPAKIGPCISQINVKRPKLVAQRTKKRREDLVYIRTECKDCDDEYLSQMRCVLKNTRLMQVRDNQQNRVQPNNRLKSAIRKIHGHQMASNVQP